MRTVADTVDDLQRAAEAWVLWARRLEALVIANPVHCRCWSRNGRNGTQDHIGACAEWREIAASIRMKANMTPGPVKEDVDGPV